MEKRMTKKGWFLGLLMGLVILVGAVPAMASYVEIGIYSGNDSVLVT